MGRTHTANSDGSFFDLNFSGVDVIGQVHNAVDAPYKKIYPNEIFYSPLTVATKEQAEECAEKIKNADDKVFTTIFEEFREMTISKDMTFEEFKRWVYNWADWLEKSGGYRVI